MRRLNTGFKNLGNLAEEGAIRGEVGAGDNEEEDGDLMGLASGTSNCLPREGGFFAFPFSIPGEGEGGRW